MATRSAVNRDIRSFAFVWTGVTIIIGVATFFAIYLTYGNSGNDLSNQGVALPLAATETPASVALAPTNPATAVPTRVIPSNTPQPTPTPTEEPPAGGEAVDEGVAVAQAVEEPTVTPTLLPINDTDYQVGVQVQYSIDLNPDVQNIWMNDVQELGLGWFKQQVRWDQYEPQEDTYDWSPLDLSLPIASERGLKVLVSVVTSPEWARESGVNTEEVGPPADYADYVDFVVKMLERYPGQIHAIEVWNEQNIAREWTAQGGLSASDYIDLLRVTYAAVKEVDPGVIVVSGALAPTGVSDGINAINDFQYMDQMIAAGLLNYTDCVGAHHNGYNISPSVTWDAVPNDPDATFRGPFDNPHHSWSFRSTLQTYANKIAVAGGDQRLCVTEFGWPSVEDMDGYPAGFEFALDNTLEEQAEWTVEALNNMEEWDIVWLAFIWNLNYGPQAGWSTESDNTPYSLIGPEWARRPAYEAIKQWSAERNAQ
ncbi:MAG: hypothetical protein OHK0046_31780 [Anaerolineae bacterium]